jgi:hypothetical protein
MNRVWKTQDSPTNTQLLETTKTNKAFTVVSRGMKSASDCKRRLFLKRNRFKPL